MRYAELSMQRIKELLGQVDTVVLPIGTTEAHGPHLPLGTDFMIPDHFCNYIERELGDKLLIAPTVNYGCSWSLSAFPGTLSVSGEVLAEYIAEICRSFVKWGLINIVFLNGHGGNIPALNLAAQKAADAGAKVLLINWWSDYMPQILEICDSRGHAGEDETSAVMAVAPELVALPEMELNLKKPIGRIFSSDIGTIAFTHALDGDPSGASREKGEKVFDIISKEIIALIQAFMQGKYVK